MGVLDHEILYMWVYQIMVPKPLVSYSSLGKVTFPLIAVGILRFAQNDTKNCHSEGASAACDRRIPE